MAFQLSKDQKEAQIRQELSKVADLWDEFVSLCEAKGFPVVAVRDIVLKHFPLIMSAKLDGIVSRAGVFDLYDKKKGS